MFSRKKERKTIRELATYKDVFVNIKKKDVSDGIFKDPHSSL